MNPRRIDKHDNIDVKMLRFPIEPEKFMESMRSRLLSLEPKFTFGAPMLEAFTIYAASYNQTIERNVNGKEPMRVVIPSPTGAGKSVSSHLYLSMLPTLGHSGLLIVGMVEDAIKATKTINDLARGNIARCYYSDKGRPKTPEYCDVPGLKEYPIIVITHAMFLNRSATLHNINDFRLYNGIQRGCVIIDEKIDFRRTVSFTNRDVEILSSYIHNVDGMDTVEEVAKKLSTIKPEPPCMVINMGKSVSKVINHVAQCIRNGDGEISNPADNRPEDELRRRRKVVNILDSMAYVLNGTNVIVKQGKLIISSRNLDLTNQFGSCCILDATSEHSPIYDAHSITRDDIQNFTMPDGVRDYSSVTLNVCLDKGRGQSADKLTNHKNKDERAKVIDNYLEELYPLVEDGGKLLVITFKKLKGVFQSRCKSDNITFIHWGIHAGTNAYSSYTKVAIIGYYRRSVSKYTNDIDAIKCGVANYSAMSGKITGDVRFMIRMGIATSSVQGFSRCAIRVPTDSSGKCAPCQLYLFDDGGVGCPASSVVEMLPGLKVMEWIPIKRMPKKMRSNVIKGMDMAVEYLTGLRGSSATLEMVADYVDVSKRTLVRWLSKDLFLKMLAESDINYIVRPGTLGNYFDVPELYELGSQYHADKRLASAKTGQKFSSIFS